MTRGDAVRLVALLAGFVVAGYAAVRLLAGNPLGVLTWFAGSAVVHDLVLFPIYAGLDAALVTLLRRWPALATVGGVGWLNHLRVPVVVSGVLLVVWSPLILQLSSAYTPASGLTAAPYAGRWLAVTGTLFAVSAGLFAVRLVRARRARSGQERRPEPGEPPARQEVSEG